MKKLEIEMNNSEQNKSKEVSVFLNSDSEYRVMNMEYLRNMLMSVRYQNGIELDPDNMTYEELLQL